VNDTTRATIVRLIGDIAPEADTSGLDGNADMRDALDLDSMDFLHLVVAVAKELGVEIAEMDYPSVVSLDGMVAYVDQHRRSA
jgi:acyl carrier protein